MEICDRTLTNYSWPLAVAADGGNKINRALCAWETNQRAKIIIFAWDEREKCIFSLLSFSKLNKIRRLYYYVIQFETQTWINNEQTLFFMQLMLSLSLSLSHSLFPSTSLPLFLSLVSVYHRRKRREPLNCKCLPVVLIGRQIKYCTMENNADCGAVLVVGCRVHHKKRIVVASTIF